MPAGRLGGSHDRATVMEAAAAGATGTASVVGGSRVRLRTLSQRRDRDGWVIGRPETGRNEPVLISTASQLPQNRDVCFPAEGTTKLSFRQLSRRRRFPS
jgi:hypothetical protein